MTSSEFELELESDEYSELELELESGMESVTPPLSTELSTSIEPASKLELTSGKALDLTPAEVSMEAVSMGVASTEAVPIEA